MLRYLLIPLSALFVLGGCTEPDAKDPNRIGEVDIGAYAPNANLLEICLDEVAYYALHYRDKFALAERLDPDGRLVTCSHQRPHSIPVFRNNDFGKVYGNRSVGEVCIHGVSYYYVHTIYSAGLAAKRQPDGLPVRCVQR